MAYNPPISSIYHLYTTYILPSGGLYATYHLLREPETTIEYTNHIPSLKLTACPGKLRVERLLSFWGLAYFQGLLLLVSGNVINRRVQILSSRLIQYKKHGLDDLPENILQSSG